MSLNELSLHSHSFLYLSKMKGKALLLENTADLSHTLTEKSALITSGCDVSANWLSACRFGSELNCLAKSDVPQFFLLVAV